MEIILALVVVIAVIIFGALLSMGNERQRRAIDELREQVVLWAMQDLRIKREKFAREVKVDDPLAWLNKVTSNAVGFAVNLQVVESFVSPRAFVCGIEDSTRKFVFSPYSPRDIRRFKKEQSSRLSQYALGNPLFSVPKGSTVFEISALNTGLLFDLELSVAWKAITGQDMEQIRLWLYLLD